MNQRNLGGIKLDTPQILGIFVGQEFDWQHPLAWTVIFFFLYPISSHHPASQPFIHLHPLKRGVPDPVYPESFSPTFTHHPVDWWLTNTNHHSPFIFFVLGRLRPTWSWHRAAARWRQKSFRSWKNRRNARAAMPPARLRRYLRLRS